MNKRDDAAGRIGKIALGGLAAALLLNSTARAELVNVIAPAAAACVKTQAIEDLEGSIVEEQARSWAYLMKQPGFSASAAALPGADIASAEIKTFFYSRLRFWLRQDSAAKPPAATLKRLNDAAQSIRMMAEQCG